MMPKRGVIKYRKYHKGCIANITATRIFCCPDIPVTEIIMREPVRITSRHLNSIRKTVRRLVKKQGRLIRLLINFWPITAKPAQIRMGKGKGATSYWAGRIKSGNVIASFINIKMKISNKILRVAATKVPGRTWVTNNYHLFCDRNPDL